MKLDQWHKDQVKKIGDAKKTIADRAVELAKTLDVATDDAAKMELLHSLAIHEAAATGKLPAGLNGE